MLPAPTNQAPINFSAIKMVPNVAATIKAAQPTFSLNPIASNPANAPALVNAIKNAAVNIYKNTAIPDIIHAAQTGDWQPYNDKLAANLPPITGNPKDWTPEQKSHLMSMVLGTIGGEGMPEEPNIPSDTGTGQTPPAGEPNIQPPTGETGVQTPETPSPSSVVSSTERNAGRGSSQVNPNINPEHLNVSPEAKTLLNDLGDDLSPKTSAKVGPVMSDAEVKAFAEANPDLALNQTSREASLKANAAMLQARQRLGAQLEAIQNGTASPEDQAAIIKNFLAVKTTATDLGRSLQKLSVSADPTQGSTVADIISKIAKAGASVDDIIAAAKNVDFTNYNQVVSFYRQFVKPTAGDWLDLVRYNSMLSSPLTLSNISAGNAFNIATQPFVKSTAGAIDWLKTGFTGGEQTHFIGEGPAYAAGALQNIGEAFGKFTDVLSGNLDPKMLDFNVPIAAEGTEGTFVKVMNIFSTLHNAMYQFFNTIAKGGEEAALNVKAANGIENVLPDITAQNAADYTTFRAGTMPEGQGHLLNAIDSVANTFKQWSASDNPYLAWPTKFTLPFLRISTNMAKQMVEYSPAGFATIAGSADGITQFAKATLGTAAFAAIGTMAATGNITGAAPTNPADKQAFDASGRQAYSIKIGDKWISYNKLPPSMSIPMLLAASYVQSQASGQGKDVMQSILDAFGAFGQYFADQSYVKNIGDLMSAMQGGTTKSAGGVVGGIETLISNDAQQLIPFRAFSAWLAKMTDPNQRKIDTSKGAIQTELQSFFEQFPGLREQVPAKTDATGNVIPNSNRFLNAFSPFQASNTSQKQEQSYQDYQNIAAISKQETAASKLVTDQATIAMQKIQSLSTPIAKLAYLKQVYQQNPTVAQKVISLLKTPQNLTPTEKKLYGASTATRAQFIAQQLNALPTVAQKKALLVSYAQKKIVTAAVIKAIAPLIKK